MFHKAGTWKNENSKVYGFIETEKKGEIPWREWFEVERNNVCFLPFFSFTIGEISNMCVTDACPIDCSSDQSRK